MESPVGASAEELEISVKTMDSKVYTTRILSDKTVSDLKELITEQTTVSQDRQRLIYRGRVMEDAHTIASYNMVSGHTIHMIARPENYRDLARAESLGSAGLHSGATMVSASDSIHGNNTNTPSPLGMADMLTHRGIHAALGEGGWGSTRNETNATSANALGLGNMGLPSSLTGQDNAGAALSEQTVESLEPLWQGLLSLHTLLSVTGGREASVAGPGPLASLGFAADQIVPPIIEPTALSDAEVDVDADAEGAWPETVGSEANGEEEEYEPDFFPMSPLPGDSEQTQPTLTDLTSDHGRSTSPNLVYDSIASAASSSAPTSPSVSVTATSTAAPLADSAEQSPWNSHISYFEGQWLDVKDTVAQWLEATAMKVDNINRRVFVHYNGWPTRWDEWIAFDSPRIALFRSRTRHTAVSGRFQSPEPVTRVSIAPRVGHQDPRSLFPELAKLLRRIQPLIDEAADIVDLEDRDNAEGASASAPASANQPVAPNVTMPMSRVAHSLPWTSHETRSPAQSSSPSRAEVDAATSAVRLAELSDQLCPLFDRMGRVMVDYAPHLRTAAQPLYMAMDAAADTDTAGGARVRRNSTGSALDVLTANANVSGGTSSPEELALASLLRLRPPSPDPEQAFRQPIVNRMGVGSSLGSTLAALGASGHHVDIHLAFLAPRDAMQQRNTERAALSQTLSSLTNILNLQSMLTGNTGESTGTGAGIREGGVEASGSTQSEEVSLGSSDTPFDAERRGVLQSAMDTASQRVRSGPTPVYGARGMERDMPQLEGGGENVVLSANSATAAFLSVSTAPVSFSPESVESVEPVQSSPSNTNAQNSAGIAAAETGNGTEITSASEDANVSPTSQTRGSARTRMPSLARRIGRIFGW